MGRNHLYIFRLWLLSYCSWHWSRHLRVIIKFPFQKIRVVVILRNRVVEGCITSSPCESLSCTLLSTIYDCRVSWGIVFKILFLRWIITINAKELTATIISTVGRCISSKACSTMSFIMWNVVSIWVSILTWWGNNTLILERFRLVNLILVWLLCKILSFVLDYRHSSDLILLYSKYVSLRRITFLLCCLQVF